MNIVLIGYRGTGKSVVGRLVAEQCGMDYVSTDTLIVERAGMSIPDYVAQHGWPAFRDLESEIAREVAKLENTVIDTGGGIIERPENIEALRATGRTVWLQAGVATIVSRIQGDTNRPSVTGQKSFTEEVAEVLARRTEKYRAAADVVIDTDPLTPEEVAAEVVKAHKAA